MATATLQPQATKNWDVSFGRVYSVPPIVLVTSSSSRMAVEAKDVTTRGCSIGVRNVSNGQNGAPSTVAWIALPL